MASAAAQSARSPKGIGQATAPAAAARGRRKVRPDRPDAEALSPGLEPGLARAASGRGGSLPAKAQEVSVPMVAGPPGRAESALGLASLVELRGMLGASHLQWTSPRSF